MALSPNSTWLITSRLDTTCLTYRACPDKRVEPYCSTSSTQPKCMGSTRRTCCVMSRRDVTIQVEFGLYTISHAKYMCVNQGQLDWKKWLKGAWYRRKFKTITFFECKIISEGWQLAKFPTIIITIRHNCTGQTSAQATEGNDEDSINRPWVSWKYGCNVLLMDGCRKIDLSGMSPSSNSTVTANFCT